MFRIILFTVGILSLILAIIGIFLPLLPTTPLVLLSAACFVRSSTTVHTWLINNKYFGPTIKNWEKTGTISLKAKKISIFFMNLSIIVSIYFVLDKMFIIFTLILIDILVTIHLIRIPTTENLELRKEKKDSETENE